MANLFIWCATALYVVQGVIWWKTNPAQTVVMAGYVVANLGLIWTAHG